MSTFPGTYIPTGVASTERRNELIDGQLTPRLASFRQVCFYDEQARLACDSETWGVTFGNWLPTAPVKVRKNTAPCATITDVDRSYGTFKAGAVDTGADGRPRDTVEVDYSWDYFPVNVLEGFYVSAVSVINMTAIGPPTSYTVETAPTQWGGVMTDLVFAMCMEKLLLDYDLWKYRLVFAVGPETVYQGGAEITQTLETLKQNAEDRANRAMENEKFKTGNYLSPPTHFYYDSITGFGGGAIGPHGIPFLTGRLRGLHLNRFF